VSINTAGKNANPADGEMRLENYTIQDITSKIWTTSLKAAATRQYSPSVRERLGMRIHLTPKLTAVLSGHDKTRAYLHRFKLTLRLPD